MKILNKIKSPRDIKGLNKSEIQLLTQEIRHAILSTVSKNGGHLASNLGMVEATVALHRVFDAPSDKILFDVGHQSYAHKLLTGRYPAFRTLRRFGGISGFTDRRESEYDAANAGHCGTSVSAALGFARAEKLKGTENYAVAVVGDGSFTNGTVYEALNNCTSLSGMRLIILLNDNEMSISKNVGNVSEYLRRVRTSRKYYSFKHKVEDTLEKVPFVGSGLARGAKYVKDVAKSAVVTETLFENLGIPYFGPVDGNDVENLEVVLREAKKLQDCCIVHMITKKGKGYAPAEKTPDIYHAVGKFDIDEGYNPPKQSSFSSEFGKAMCEIADDDGKICAVTAAMCDGTGLSHFARLYPERMFDVGIAEEHAVAFCGGLSLSGYHPVCALYSTFAQRTYDMVLHDVAIQGTPMTIALDRAGIVPDDGVTHQGIYDVSLFSSVPGLEIFSPETYTELHECLREGVNSPPISVIRYPKGKMWEYDREKFISCGSYSYADTGEGDPLAVIFTYGRITKNVYEAALALNVPVRVVKLIKIFPLDINELLPLTMGARLIYVAEEGVKPGGIYEKLSSLFCGRVNVPVEYSVIENGLLPHGSVEELMRYCRLDSGSLKSDIEEKLKRYGVI